MSGIAQALLMSRAGSSAAPIAPSAITGLKLWLDAQTGLTRGAGAARFVRANTEYLSKASNSDLQAGDIDFTFAGWAKMDSTSGNYTLFCKDETGARDYQLTYLTGTGMLWQVFTAGETGRNAIINSGISANTWFFFVAWHDSTANTVNLQINNGSVTSNGTTASLQAPTSSAFRVGYSGTTTTFGLDGSMQNLGYWKRVLNSTERSTLYNSGNGVNYSDLSSGMKTSLVSWWAFGEADGNRADSHGTNTLTDNNTVLAGIGKVAGSGGTPTDGQLVGVWADQSGLGGSATPSLGAPVYRTGVSGLGGKNALDFTNDFVGITVDSAARRPTTYALVMRPDVYGSSRYFLGASSTNGTVAQFNSAGVAQFVMNNSGVGSASNAVTAGSACVLVFTCDGSGNYTYRINGVANGSGTANFTPAASTQGLGDRISGFGSPYDGLIAEVCHYDSVLSAPDIAGLEAYLGQKYGITI